MRNYSPTKCDTSVDSPTVLIRLLPSMLQKLFSFIPVSYHKKMTPNLTEFDASTRTCCPFEAGGRMVEEIDAAVREDGGIDG